jgi:hypothetical protein
VRRILHRRKIFIQSFWKYDVVFVASFPIVSWLTIVKEHEGPLFNPCCETQLCHPLSYLFTFAVCTFSGLLFVCEQCCHIILSTSDFLLLCIEKPMDGVNKMAEQTTTSSSLALTTMASSTDLSAAASQAVQQGIQSALPGASASAGSLPSAGIKQYIFILDFFLSSHDTNLMFSDSQKRRRVCKSVCISAPLSIQPFCQYILLIISIHIVGKNPKSSKGSLESTWGVGTLTA